MREKKWTVERAGRVRVLNSQFGCLGHITGIVVILAKKTHGYTLGTSKVLLLKVVTWAGNNIKKGVTHLLGQKTQVGEKESRGGERKLDHWNHWSPLTDQRVQVRSLAIYLRYYFQGLEHFLPTQKKNWELSSGLGGSILLPATYSHY